MTGTQKMLTAVAAVAAIGFAAAADAAPWSNPSGSTANFSYSGGLSDNGLFGDPIVTDDGFTFTPANFIATSVGGTPAAVSDRTKVVITANPGEEIDKIVLRELGDYSILGMGGIQVGGALFVSYDGGPLAGIAAETEFDPDMPVINNDPNAGLSGVFEGMAMIDVPEGVSEVVVVFNNSLLAVSSESGASTVQKKTAGAGVEIDVIVPEPTSLALLGLAGPLLMRRRR